MRDSHWFFAIATCHMLNFVICWIEWNKSMVIYILKYACMVDNTNKLDLDFKLFIECVCFACFLIGQTKDAIVAWYYTYSIHTIIYGKITKKYRRQTKYNLYLWQTIQSTISMQLNYNYNKVFYLCYLCSIRHRHNNNGYTTV